MAVISSFAYDEPLREVFEAASELPNVYFYITGDKKNADKNLLIKKLDNVIMTGFLDYNCYVDLLQKVDVIMDLTTENTSLVAGAYEAATLEKPLITSDWIPLKRYFNKGTIYINNSTEEIKRAIMFSYDKKRRIIRRNARVKKERTKDWIEKISNFSYLFH